MNHHLNRALIEARTAEFLGSASRERVRRLLPAARTSYQALKTMTIPTVVELPRALEAVSRDPFVDSLAAPKVQSRRTQPGARTT